MASDKRYYCLNLSSFTACLCDAAFLFSHCICTLFVSFALSSHLITILVATIVLSLALFLSSIMHLSHIGFSFFLFYLLHFFFFQCGNRKKRRNEDENKRRERKSKKEWKEGNKEFPQYRRKEEK